MRLNGGLGDLCDDAGHVELKSEPQRTANSERATLADKA